MQFYSFLSLGLLLLPFGSCRPGPTENLHPIHTAQAIDEDTTYNTVTTSSFITSILMTAPAATGSGVPIDYQASNSGYNLTTSIPALSTSSSVILTTPTTSFSTTVRPTHSEAEVDGLDYFVDWSDSESDLEDEYYVDDREEDEDHEVGAVGAAPYN
ncbi:Apyrase [Ceratocystis lukuohia]|uniref:Apyrase n=1 Tax=Ceratocystis lukuohia TaxID=2019550 RepID=A0ABR4MJS6_9PEZI